MTNLYSFHRDMTLHIRRADQAATRIRTAALAPFQITTCQFAVLACLNAHGAMSQNRLGRAVAMDPATVGGVVLRLCKARLVRRVPNTVDRRRLTIELTLIGARRAAAASDRVHRAEAKDLTAALLCQQIVELETLLKRLVPASKDTHRLAREILDAA